MHIDIDATLVIDHSDNKENAASTWKKSFGHHPLLAFLDRPEIAGGEALAGLLRKGNAGSNTAADHVAVLEQALASLPPEWRPGPHNPAAPTVVVRSDSAGPPTASPRPAAITMPGSPSATPSMPACKTPWTPSTSATPGTRRSRPPATSATAHGWPRRPVWSTCPHGPPGPG
ncbi:putative iSMsm3 transposase [Mycobacterium kansasii 732]|nr:putative iSMsm3 transposase [Mycobacterium kansasii 732]